MDQQILEELVQYVSCVCCHFQEVLKNYPKCRMYMPEVIEHLLEVSIPISLITLPWLLCLFIGHVKPEVG